jgi:serine/threonine protein kinase
MQPPPGHTSDERAYKGVYKKVRRIGQGAFGTVFLAAHRRSGQQLVLKEVPLKGMSISAAVHQVEEIHLLKRLHHQHLIAYRASYLDEATLTLVIFMEFAEGGDLETRIEKQKKRNPPHFPEALVLKWLAQSMVALDYCHHVLKLLHRDIKPANLLLTAQEDIKIGDFGMSKTLAASHMQAQTNCGTPVYMSPDLVQGGSYDRSADVWALGCTLYHVMALKQPWMDRVANGKGMALLMNLGRVIQNEQLDLEPLRAHYSFELCAALAAMVAKEYASRPALRSLLQAAPIRDTPEAKAVLAESGGMLRSIGDCLQCFMGGNNPAGRTTESEPSGIESHTAAAKLQRSFRKQVSRGHFQQRGKRGVLAIGIA